MNIHDVEVVSRQPSNHYLGEEKFFSDETEDSSICDECNPAIGCGDEEVYRLRESRYPQVGGFFPWHRVRDDWNGNSLPSEVESGHDAERSDKTLAPEIAHDHRICKDWDAILVANFSNPTTSPAVQLLRLKIGGF